MNGQLALQDRKRGSVLPASRFLQHTAVRPIADHTVQAEAEPGGALTESRFGQDFSRVAVHAASDAARSDHTPACPVTPTRCPFGGACHTCPARVQTKLAINQPGDEYEQEADRVADHLTSAPGMQLQRRATSQVEPAGVPPIVHDVLRSPGQPLDPATRAFMEPRFGHDFSTVRVHTGAKAAESARAVNALAYTVGRDVVFGAGEYSPQSNAGLKLMAHELTHAIQQSQDQAPIAPTNGGIQITALGSSSEGEAEALAQHVVSGQSAGSVAAHGQTGSARLQRQVHGTPSPVSVRSPAFEELVTQVSMAQAGLMGRPLTSNEVGLVRRIFGSSIDYSRVRLIPTGILEYRTVANTIRVPENFTINNDYMAQTLIHEMTHVWQYQHGGTSYVSVSLATQIAGTIRTGSRNAAYDYQIIPDKSFFDFLPEQQGLIVENYFSMLRDQNAPPRLQYIGNHLDARGEFQTLSRSDRMREIAKELPLHGPLIKQMQVALPRPEGDLLTARATEVMRTPLEGMAPIPEERRLAPLKPLLEIRF